VLLLVENAGDQHDLADLLSKITDIGI